MAKSKRAKVVHLSKTQKKGKELSQRLYANVRESADTHQYCFVFSVENMRNTYLKEVRTEFSDSRLFFGKTKVMATALGLTPERSHLPGLHLLAPHLTGNVGLLFTSRPPSEILAHFAAYAVSDYARAGTVATRTFTIPAGVVHSRAGEIHQDDDVPVAHSLEPGMRALGVPTRLVKGRIELAVEHRVVKEGAVMDSKQTRLLKMFGVQMAEFSVGIKAYWSAATAEIVVVDGGPKETVEEAESMKE